MENDEGVGKGMVLSTLSISNFRSLHDATIPLQPDVTVLVGENNSGKSNVIDALRLTLAPHGSRRSRYFEVGDVSFGREQDTVELVATFGELTAIQRGLYATALDLSDMTARIATRFSIDPERPQRSRPVITVGPGDGPESEPERREDLRHVYLEPLRDAQRELDSSTSRRLAAIIEALHTADEVEAFVEETNEGLREIETHSVVEATQTQVGERLSRLTAPVRGQQMGIKFSDYRLQRLAVGLRIKMAEAGVDLADLTESGLGYANLLYIATVLLQLDKAEDAELTVLLVEEPEAHLHPQLQTVLLDYLREQAEGSGRNDEAGPAGRIQVVVTTHSPLVAAGVPINKIVVLRSGQVTEVLPPALDGDGVDVGGAPTDEPVEVIRTVTKVVPICDLGLDTDQIRKLGQYLDATKAALLFGTRVILVEGVSEAVLLPPIARRLFNTANPEDIRRRRAISGLTIVNIGSVDFQPYVDLLLTKIDDISILDQLVVITDTDPPVVDEPDEDDGEDEPTDGEKQAAEPSSRLARLAAAAKIHEGLRVHAATWTLEADLLGVPANEPTIRNAFIAQKPRSHGTWAEIMAAEMPGAELYRRMRKNKKFIAKGEFAHELALAIEDNEPFECPSYLASALANALV